MPTETKEKTMLTNTNKEKAERFLAEYFTYLKGKYFENKLERWEQIQALFMLSSAYPNLKSPEEWEEIGYKLCWEIKSYLEATSPNLYGGMFSSGGVGHLAYLVNMYQEKTGNLSGFSRDLNALLLEVNHQYSQTYLHYILGAKSAHFDVIQGISGALYYLLDFDWNQEDTEKLRDMLRYLASLTENYQYKNQEVMKFHIHKENIFLDAEKQIYPDGVYDFGIAHGIVGPLLALDKAKSKGITIAESERAIKKIWEMYETFTTIENGIALWPGKLDYHDYLKGLLDKNYSYQVRASWCYGNLGIARALQLAARYEGNGRKEQLYGKYLKDIIIQPSKDYLLDNFCICHGYASVLAIASYFYEETSDNNVADKINEIVEKFFVQLDAHYDNYETLFERKEFQKMFFETQEDFIDGFLEGPEGLLLTLINLLYPQPALGQLLLIQ